MRVARQLKRPEANKNVDNTGLVTSSQTGIHPHLEKYVHRHLETAWLQTFHQPTVDIYHRLKNEDDFAMRRSFILDSGCGTGKSTQRLAALFPRHIVIGVDQSRVRLAKSAVNSGFSRSGNCILLRAELTTFWRLLVNDGYSPERHYLFYPNPWPKPGHLLRRWHGHPVFPHLLRLGDEIEMRCNWEIYALEFVRAVYIATGAIVKVKKFQPETAISPFEQKYLERGQILYSVIVPARN